MHLTVTAALARERVVLRLEAFIRAVSQRWQELVASEATGNVCEHTVLAALKFHSPVLKPL